MLGRWMESVKVEIGRERDENGDGPGARFRVLCCVAFAAHLNPACTLNTNEQFGKRLDGQSQKNRPAYQRRVVCCQ